MAGQGKSPPVPIPIAAKPGVTRDCSEATAETCIDALWTRWDGDTARKIRGYRVANRQLTDISRGLGAFSTGGSTYVHSAGQSKLEQVILDRNGSSSGIIDRTPSLMVANADLDWTFDNITDSVTLASMVLAHGGHNLTNIDASDELPVFWGFTTDSASLSPMALPILGTGTTINTQTGAITSSSATVTGLDTTQLTYGMQVFGTGIPAAAHIISVDSASQVTLSATATATNATASLTFKVGGVSGGVISLFPYVAAYGSDGRFVWSTNKNPNDFWGNGSGEAFITDQKIVKMLRARAGPGLEPGALSWSLNTLHRITFRGGDTVWGADVMDDGISVLSARSIIMVDGVAYWPGVDKFYMFAGSLREIPNDQNDNWFFDNMNWDHRGKAFSFYDSRWGEVWFCAPLFGNTEPSHAVILNVRTGAWYDTQLPNGGRSAALPAGVFRYPLMTGIDPLGSPAKYRLWQHEYGVNEVNERRTVAIRSYFTMPQLSLLTNQQQPMNREMRIVKLEPDLSQVGDMTVSVLKRATPRGALVTAEQTTIPADPTPQQEFIGFKQQGRRIHLQFESNVTDGDFQFKKMIAHADLGDRREVE